MDAVGRDAPSEDTCAGSATHTKRSSRELLVCGAGGVEFDDPRTLPQEESAVETLVPDRGVPIHGRVEDELGVDGKLVGGSIALREGALGRTAVGKLVGMRAVCLHLLVAPPLFPAPSHDVLRSEMARPWGARQILQYGPCGGPPPEQRDRVVLP